MASQTRRSRTRATESFDDALLRARNEAVRKQRALRAAAPPFRSVLDAFHDETKRRRLPPTDEDIVRVVEIQRRFGVYGFEVAVLRIGDPDSATVRSSEAWSCERTGQQATVAGLANVALLRSADACAAAWVALYVGILDPSHRRRHEQLHYRQKDVWPWMVERVSQMTTPPTDWGDWD